MKKALKIIGIIFLILVIIAGSLIIWQWDNVKSVYLGLTKSEKEIAMMRNQNQEKLINRIDSYLDEPLRPLTEEEEQLVEEGKTSLQDVYLKIFEERVSENADGKQTVETAEMEALQKDKKTSSSTEKGKNSGDKEKPSKTKKSEKIKKETKQPTKDEIVNRHMAQLYSLQSEFTGRAEGLISQGDSYYESLKKTQGASAARSNTISHFTPIVRGLESECDSRVAAVVSNLQKELNAIGADTDIIGTIRTTYENEKQLKLSYYTNRYLR